MATYIKKIRTDAGDLQIDYNALANLPKYAGSSSAGGAATSADKINTNAGSATQPVYFANGIPVKTTYTLSKSVPSNAVFTDTHYASKNVVGTTSATSNTTTALTNGSVYLNSVENGAVTSSHKISGSGAATVTTDASGNIIVKSTNTTYSAATTSSDGLMSAADKKIVNTVSNPNLLINSDFRNPVNQRGETTYKSTANNFSRIYTIDRWNMQNGCKCVVNSGSITLSGDSAANGVSIFSQIIEKPCVGDYVLQVKVLSLSGGATVDVYNASSQVVGTATLSVGVNVVSIINNSVYFVQINVGSSTSLQLEWIKLEAGTAPTQFSPRIYAEEIALCRRFFDIMGGTRTIGVEQNYDTNTFTYAVPRNVLMRTTPTISIHGTTTTNSTDGICVRTIGCAILQGFTFTYSLRGWELLVVAKSSTALNKMCYETQLYINDAFKIYLDAEIY